METKSKKKKKGRMKKIYLEFDEEKRKQFLTGFHQRKLERKRKAREELELRKKEEKKRLKEERKNILKEMYFSQRSVPEIEHLVEPVTYELPDHTVTVTSVDEIDFVGNDGTRLGKNKFEYFDQEHQGDASQPATEKLSQNLKNITKNLKKQKYLFNSQNRKHKHAQGKKGFHRKKPVKKRDKKALRFKQSTQ